MGKNEKKSSKKVNFTQRSFKTTYYFMIFACILALVTSYFVKSDKIRHILWVEALITGFASYIYSLYSDTITKNNLTHKTTYGWGSVDVLRYIDWSITTPLMLISLMLVLSMNTGIALNGFKVLGIVLLDWIMLYLGYLGETGLIGKQPADFFGFIPLLLIFWIIYCTFVKNKNIRMNNIIFFVYLLIWCCYGILYLFNQKTMNTVFNILDCIAKAFVTIGLSVTFMQM